MAIDIPTILGGLGATVAAFGNPQQSLMMSQGILQRNQQIRDRKERERQQQQQLAIQQQKVAIQQAQMRQEQAQREAGMQMLAQQMNPNVGAQLASTASAVYRPGQSAGVPTNPMEEAAMVRTAITGETPFPFMPAPTLKPGLFSGTAGQQREAIPEFVKQHARTLAALGDTEGASEVLMKAQAQQRKDAMPPEPTATMRNFEDFQNMPPAQQKEFLAYRRAGGETTNINLSKAWEAKKPPAVYSEIYGPADKGKIYQYDENDNHIMVPKTDAQTGHQYEIPLQVSKTDRELTSEETRTVALADTVVSQVGQVRDALVNFGAGDRAAYAARGVPIIGDFLANTEGGRARTLHDNSIQNTGFMVSGAEAPEREVARLERYHGFTVHDNLETALMKLDAQEALARRVQKYRFSKGEGDGEGKRIPAETMQKFQSEVNAELQASGKPPMPYGFTPPPGYTYQSYVDRGNGVYVFVNDKGERKFVRAQDVSR